MKFKLLLLLGVFFIASSAVAQENKFPISGEYVIANDQFAVDRNYNSISVSGEFFHFVRDGKIVTTFKIKSVTDKTYYVEQFFETNNDIKRDRLFMEITVLKEDPIAKKYNLYVVAMNHNKEYITLVPKK